MSERPVPAFARPDSEAAWRPGPLELADARLVIDFAIVDTVIESQLLHAVQFLSGRSGAVGLDAKQLANLNRGCPDSTANGVNQHATAAFAFDVHGLDGVRSYAGFPIGEIRGEEIHRERC